MSGLDATIVAQLFWGTLVLFALLDAFRPYRQRREALGIRWVANFGLGGVNILLARWLVPVAIAVISAKGELGLFRHVSLPLWVEVVAGFLILDLMHYGLHRLFHAAPLFWRMHRVHHSDRDVDFSTGARHHPLELVVIMAASALVILVFGLSPLAILAYEAVRAVIDFASHANLRLNQRFDRVLRWVIITPDMHRIHHSDRRAETDSNFSNLLTWWDRIFGTYRAEPRNGHESMSIGLREWQEGRRLSLPHLLLMPFRRR